jgi:RNA polymerase sigma-70 factor (ECF subfamily)
MGQRGATPADRPIPPARPFPPVRGQHPIVAEFNAIRDELVSTLVYVLGNRDDALDVAQEAFLKCWRSRETMDDVQNLRAWIFRVGLNTAKDLQRSAWSRRVKTLVLEELMIATREAAPAALLEDRETLDRLRVAIAELRTEEKEVFLLRQNGDLTYEQIAEIRHVPVGTVKTQMRAALMNLRKVLNPPETSATES